MGRVREDPCTVPASEDPLNSNPKLSNGIAPLALPQLNLEASQAAAATDLEEPYMELPQSPMSRYFDGSPWPQGDQTDHSNQQAFFLPFSAAEPSALVAFDPGANFQDPFGFAAAAMPMDASTAAVGSCVAAPAGTLETEQAAYATLDDSASVVPAGFFVPLWPQPSTSTACWESGACIPLEQEQASGIHGGHSLALQAAAEHGAGNQRPTGLPRRVYVDLSCLREKTPLGSSAGGVDIAVHGSTPAGAATHGECNGDKRCAAGAAACRGSMGGQRNRRNNPRH